MESRGQRPHRPNEATTRQQKESKRIEVVEALSELMRMFNPYNKHDEPYYSDIHYQFYSSTGKNMDRKLDLKDLSLELLNLARSLSVYKKSVDTKQARGELKRLPPSHG